MSDFTKKCGTLLSKLYNKKGRSHLYLMDILDDISSEEIEENNIILGAIVDIMFDNCIIDEEYNWNFISFNESELNYDKILDNFNLSSNKIFDINEHPN